MCKRVQKADGLPKWLQDGLGQSEKCSRDHKGLLLKDLFFRDPFQGDLVVSELFLESPFVFRTVVPYHSFPIL